MINPPLPSGITVFSVGHTSITWQIKMFLVCMEPVHIPLLQVKRVTSLTSANTNGMTGVTLGKKESNLPSTVKS